MMKKETVLTEKNLQDQLWHYFNLTQKIFYNSSPIGMNKSLPPPTSVDLSLFLSQIELGRHILPT